MPDDIFNHMQQAVDIVGTSEHPTNKIAAVLAGKDTSGQSFSLARFNYWPQAIKEKLGPEARIGNSSGTVHAETACILHAPMTNGAFLFVTDAPCPNCVKNMTEAGIKALYIDHKGFDKDFATRRGEDFRTMSMDICRKAGISVYKIFRKEQRTEAILEIRENYRPVIEKPARMEPLKDAISRTLFESLVKAEAEYYKGRPFAIAIATGRLGKAFMISAEIHPVAGFTSKAEAPEGKYNYLLQPVHRVLMSAARFGLKISEGYIYSSRVPTAREIVNLTGAGFGAIYIGDEQHARDEHGIEALRQVSDAGIMRFLKL